MLSSDATSEAETNVITEHRFDRLQRGVVGAFAKTGLWAFEHGPAARGIAP